jgi:hypothetical protein
VEAVSLGSLTLSRVLAALLLFRKCFGNRKVSSISIGIGRLSALLVAVDVNDLIVSRNEEWHNFRHLLMLSGCSSNRLLAKKYNLFVVVIRGRREINCCLARHLAILLGGVTLDTLSLQGAVLGEISYTKRLRPTSHVPHGRKRYRRASHYDERSCLLASTVEPTVPVLVAYNRTQQEKSTSVESHFPARFIIPVFLTLGFEIAKRVAHW